MARGRNKIRYCYEDYMKTVTDTERLEYQRRYAPLIDIIARGENDREVMTMAREYDSEHSTEMLAEAIHLTVYCIACSKFDCDC
ncbi:hypothetical protein [Desulfosediminicola sp.]|uniref:hypothetical protein n=1 Tax=Desulfosediminicola sp. TaxID=2886825 RepID=UPI003AF31231